MTARVRKTRVRHSVLVVSVAVCLATAGCASPGGRTGEPASPVATTGASTRPAGSSDYIADQAASMAEEDARRTRATAAKPRPPRPGPVHSEPRSPVDQPRIR